MPKPPRPIPAPSAPPDPGRKPAAEKQSAPETKPAAGRKSAPNPAGKPASTPAGRSRPRREGVPALTKRDLICRIADQELLPRPVVETVLREMLEHIRAALVNGQAVEFRNFGVLECITRKSRLGRNPRKPSDTVTIPARRSVVFRPGKELKQLIRQP